MSSSVFKEYPSSNPDFECTDENLRIDSNLVIVVNKDGQVSSVDQKTLHSLLAHETKNTSVSYIRVTSPTPSLQEEIDEENRKKRKQKRKNKTNTVEVSGKEDEDILDNSDNDENEIDDQTPHVFVTVEGFYPPDQAKIFADKVLSLAGIENPLSIETLDYNFQRYVIRNDHCYTANVSPVDKSYKRAGADKSVDKNSAKVDLGEKSSPVTGVNTPTSRTKSSRKLREINTSESSETENTTSSQLQNILEDTSESESSEISSEEADHDSDLDYNIHSRNRKATKKSGRGGNRAIIKSSRDHHSSSSANTSASKIVPTRKRQSIAVAASELLDEPEGPTSSRGNTPIKHTNSDNNRKRLIRALQKKPLASSTPTRNSSKILNKSVPTVKYSKVQEVTNQIVKKEEINQSTSKVPTTVPITTIATTVQSKLSFTPSVNNPQIVIKKDKKPPAHVEALYSDMSSLFSTPDIIKKIGNSTANIVPPQTMPTQKIIKIANISNSTTMTGAINTAAIINSTNASSTVNNFSQQHLHKTQVEDENDKQLDLIDSIVKKELEEEKQHIQQKNSVEDEKNKHIIPNIVKMLETTSDFQQLHNQSIDEQTDTSVGASLMDDILPEDLLQHVAELAENKELQEVIDKQVLGVTNLNTILPSMNVNSIVQIVPPQQQITTPTTITIASLSNIARKDPIKIIRSDGRVITLPPIEAPATRGAKRRAQNGTVDEVKKSVVVVPVKAVQEDKMIEPAIPLGKLIIDETRKPINRRNSVQQKPVPVAPTVTPNLTIASTPAVQSNPEIKLTTEVANKSINNAPKNNRRQSSSNSAILAVLQDPDDIDSDESWNSEDDPDRLWCICKQPHNNRFMICCDVCEDWFHGKCVNITKAMGQQMELKGIEWTCPNCIKKRHEEKYGKSLHQTKLTDFLMDGTCNFEDEISANVIISKLAKDANSATASITNCIVCRKPARNSSIYCSDDCIRQHAQKTTASNSNASAAQGDISVATIVKENPNKTQKGFTKYLKFKNERVVVYEKSSGRCLSGNAAPLVSNLNQWLQEHPTFEVVQPGTPPALAIQAKYQQKMQHQKQLQLKQQQQQSSLVKQMQTKDITNVVKKPQNTVVDQLFSQPAKIQTQPKNQQFGETKKVSVINVQLQHQHQQQQPNPTIVKLKQTTLNQKSPGQQITITSMVKPQASNTQNSATNKTQNKTQNTSKTPEPEPIRINVRRTLKEQLTIRMKESKSVKMTEEEIQKFASETEKEMFLLFNRDTGAKYKSKYRSLMFNIKDRKNLTLFQKICDKSIEPKQLVRLTPDQLASQELAQWRENENKHQLEMIKKSELDLLACAKNYVLKTHKGEEVIESKINDRLQLDPNAIPVEDVVAILNNSAVSNSSDAGNASIRNDEIENLSPTPTMRYDKTKDFESSIYVRTYSSMTTTAANTSGTNSTTTVSSDHKSRRDRKESRSDKSRSRSHDRHKSSSTSKHKSKSSRDRSRDRHDRHHKDRKRERSRSRGESSSKKSRKHEHDRRSSKDNRERRSKDKDKEKEKDRDNKHKNSSSSTKSDINAGEVVSTNNSNRRESKDGKSAIGMHKNTEAATTISPSSNIPNDKSNKSEEKIPVIARKDQDDLENVPPSSTPTPQDTTAFDYDEENVPRFDDSSSSLINDESGNLLWGGSLSMTDVTELDITAHTISGDDDNLAKELPDKFEIVGRIIPEMVWDYISKIKKIPNKEIVLLRMDSEQPNLYTILYSYLQSRNRLGVVETKSTYIKDFYIIPLASAAEIPSVLLPANDDEFLKQIQRPNLLLGVIVKIKFVKKTVIPTTSSKISNRHSNRSNPGVTNLPGKNTSQSTKSVDRYGHPALTQTVPKKVAAPSVAEAVGAQRRSSLTKGLPSTKEAAPAYDEIISFYKNQNSHDDNEPYSPGGSDDGEGNSSMNISSSADNEIKMKMDEINRQIEAQKKEIAGILTNANDILIPNQPYSPSRSPIMSQNFNTTNIALPSNLGEILARFNKNAALGDDNSQNRLNEDEEYVPTPTGISNYTAGVEYHPGTSYTNLMMSSATPNMNIAKHDIDERILIPQIIPALATHAAISVAPPVHSTPSKLASLSDAELLSIIPDECLKDEVTAAAAAASSSLAKLSAINNAVEDNDEQAEDEDENNDNDDVLPPPLKISKWDQTEKQPPPPGLEDEMFDDDDGVNADRDAT